MPVDADVIVVGGGAGGATLAWAVAHAGKRVLLLERGSTPGDGAARDERSVLIDKRPYSDQEVLLNGTPRRLYVGGGPGGGTTLYGAALLRPSPDDFHPGRHYGDRLPRSLWDWPVDYRELEPFYDQAELLYGVSGPAGDDFGPLGRPMGGYRSEPAPLLPANRRLVEANRRRGLRPFRLPLAIDFRRCLRCPACAGFPCPNGARRSAADLLVGERVAVLAGVEAERFEVGGSGRVEGVITRARAGGETKVYRAARYVLAAGAVNSPAVLLRSGLDGPHVGRNYMVHLSPIVAGLFARPTGAEGDFAKQVGFSDYYFGDPPGSGKLGIVQSLPVPGPLMLAKAAGGPLPQLLAQALRRRLLPLMGIVEDLPDPANRVTVGPGGAPALRHRFSAFDRERGRRLASLMSRILKNAGAVTTLGRNFASTEHAAHQCGTLRFGRSAADAAAGPDGRLFGQPNVFVADGSVFPTSLGVGPALTIMANALRVAAIVAREV